MQQWQWINVQDGTETTLNAYTNVVLGERAVNGYLYRDGRLCPLVDVRASPELGPDYHQNALHAEFTDAVGRTAVLDATRNSAVRLDFGNSRLLINEIGCHGTLDGRPAPVLCEIGWDGTYIRRLMKRAATTVGSGSGGRGEQLHPGLQIEDELAKPLEDAATVPRSGRAASVIRAGEAQIVTPSVSMSGSSGGPPSLVIAAPPVPAKPSIGPSYPKTVLTPPRCFQRRALLGLGSPSRARHSPEGLFGLRRLSGQ
jgi:hypothetical protein